MKALSYMCVEALVVRSFSKRLWSSSNEAHAVLRHFVCSTLIDMYALHGRLGRYARVPPFLELTAFQGGLPHSHLLVK